MPVRAFVLAGCAVLGSGYALVRHYGAVPPSPPAERELPAPELVPLEK